MRAFPATLAFVSLAVGPVVAQGDRGQVAELSTTKTNDRRDIQLSLRFLF